jgi:Sigma-70 region 2
MTPTAYCGHIVTAGRFASTFGGRSALRRCPAPNSSAAAASRRWHAVCLNHRGMVFGGIRHWVVARPGRITREPALHMFSYISKISSSARFEGLCARYRPDVFRFALWLAHDGAIAEDIVQETFMRAWRAIDSLADPSATRVAIRHRPPRTCAAVRAQATRNRRPRRSHCDRRSCACFCAERGSLQHRRGDLVIGLRLSQTLGAASPHGLLH